MLLSKKTLAVINAASTDKTRFELNGVLIEGDGSGVGCDGQILVKYTPNFLPDASEYPAIEGVTVVDPEGVTLTPFILPAEACIQISKAAPKTRRFIPLIEDIALDVVATNLNGNAVMAVTDLETPQVFKPKKLDGQYPNYTKILPTNGATLTVGLGVAVLEKVLKTLKALNVEEFSFGVTDAKSPIQIFATTKDQDGKVIAVMMPRRLN